MKINDGGPKHPIYGACLGGSPWDVDGVTFYPYRRRIGSYVRVSKDFRIEVWANSSANTYCSRLDGKTIGVRFRSQETAARAAIKARETPNE